MNITHNFKRFTSTSLLSQKTATAFYTALLSMMSPPVLASSSGGLDDATDAVAEIQVWFYGFLGVACLLYMAWQVSLALTNKQDWMEVGLAFCKVAAAGGSVMGAAWAWSIWGV